MGVRVLFLGPLADIAGEDQIELPAPLSWDALLGAIPRNLADRIGEDRVRIACRGELLADKHDMLAQDGDEVALLPPVSGG